MGDTELLAALKRALPAKNGGVFINVDGDKVHKIEIGVEAYAALLAAMRAAEHPPAFTFTNGKGETVDVTIDHVDLEDLARAFGNKTSWKLAPGESKSTSLQGGAVRATITKR